MHRLVRISPFDNQGRRQTSFAAVQVWPVMDAPDVEVNDADIRMEVFRASGAGGQHVNKTSSAVRLIHEPTGLVASSQEERSQLQNREKALGRLKAMIAAKVEEEHQAERDAIGGKQAQVGWGSQIRSYVVQPYQMVKDLRTEVETGQHHRRARRRPRRVHDRLPPLAPHRLHRRLTPPSLFVSPQPAKIADVGDTNAGFRGHATARVRRTVSIVPSGSRVTWL